MEVTELFKDALTYPTKDWNKLLIFGVFFLLTGIVDILGNFGFAVNQLGGAITLSVFGLISLIITLFINGFGLSITRETINQQENIPEFEWVKNLIDGIKLLVLNIVYFIIPVIVTIIVAFATGAINHLVKIGNYAISQGVTNITPTTIPQSMIVESAASFFIVFLIAAILFIIFGLLLLIANAKLADTDSLVEACNMIEVFNKIGEIGWANFIIWIIVFVIISFVIGFIGGLIGIIPFVGLLIVLLVVYPFIKMFGSRALGLIYNESKN